MLKTFPSISLSYIKREAISNRSVKFDSVVLYFPQCKFLTLLPSHACLIYYMCMLNVLNVSYLRRIMCFVCFCIVYSKFVIHPASVFSIFFCFCFAYNTWHDLVRHIQNVRPTPLKADCYTCICQSIRQPKSVINLHI